MNRVKITSNPYIREIKFFSYNFFTDEWESIDITNEGSELREDDSEKAFLPFKIKEIIDTIIKNYYVGKPIEVVFEGAQDEYAELESVCKEENVRQKIILSRSQLYLENARFIQSEARETFEKVHPIIEKIVRSERDVIKDLNKVSEALKDIIPICVFGNYSSGKSSFINALIGNEVLPSGGDPVTAKIFKITKSEQSDCARIILESDNEAIDFSFEGSVYRIIKGNRDSEIIKKILSAIEECRNNDIFSRVNAALSIINKIERASDMTIKLGNIIEVEIPFSKNGILGQSDNKFVIFDTPGSNSASNDDHAQVLSEAMDGFSNGIPVWVSSYETLDTNDNAELCDKVTNIKALDKRFTMIVLNKADSSDLPEDGFSQEDIQEIKEYKSVNKMYASGIFFVSSIMGLGTKKKGSLNDKHYRKTFRAQQGMYSDPEDMDYATLYKFNIMPDQIKEKAVAYSEECNDLIYANSGLLCVEMEMETFASKYSAYNKCQMVYMFLNEVIKETNRKIEDRTNRLTKTRDNRNKELDGEKQKLIDSIQFRADRLEAEYDKSSIVYAKEYVKKNIDYSHTYEEIEEIDREIWDKYAEEKSFYTDQKNYEDSRAGMWDRFKQNGQSLFKGDFLDGLRNIRNDLTLDIKTIQETRQSRNETSREVDKATSDDLIAKVAAEYKKNMMEAKTVVGENLRSYWKVKSQEFRNNLIDIITGSEALSDSQREELSKVILDYQPLEFDDDADRIFKKEKFLVGNFFGLNIRDSEKINKRLLLRRYNSTIEKNTNIMALKMNEKCFDNFKNWEKTLNAIIEQNITEYNPKLRDLADMIRDDNDRILELADNKKAISDALETINEMMSWKESDYIA